MMNSNCSFQGAAVAYTVYVAEMFSTPVIFPKPVTYFVDGEKPTALEFLHNTLLDRSVTEVVGFISRKCISDICNPKTLNVFIKTQVPRFERNSLRTKLLAITWSHFMGFCKRFCKMCIVAKLNKVLYC
jgi:hypothetical protein